MIGFFVCLFISFLGGPLLICLSVLSHLLKKIIEECSRFIKLILFLKKTIGLKKFGLQMKLKTT